MKSIKINIKRIFLMITVILILINFTLNNKLKSSTKINFDLISSLKNNLASTLEINNFSDIQLNCWNYIWHNHNNSLNSVLKTTAVAAFKNLFTKIQMLKEFENIIKNLKDRNCKDNLNKVLKNNLNHNLTIKKEDKLGYIKAYDNGKNDISNSEKNKSEFDKKVKKEKSKRHKRLYFNGAISTHRNSDYLNHNFYKTLNRN